MEKEKQISIDPISLKETTNTDESHNFMAPSMITTNPSTPKLLLQRFISFSLPSSAISSPTKSLKPCRNQCHPSLPINSLSRQQSAALSCLVQHRREHMRRSKSCGDGRVSAPSDELDLYVRKFNDLPLGDNRFRDWRSEHGSEFTSKDSDSFKCGALCLFLPAFTGKGKQVKSKIRYNSGDHQPGAENTIVSRTVSLEKFECGSWSSSAILTDDEDGSTQLYFDLPLELIRTSANDALSPVTAAFVFESNHHPKSVLKKNPSTKQSHEPARHVRFSVGNLSLDSSSSHFKFSLAYNFLGSFSGTTPSSLLVWTAIGASDVDFEEERTEEVVEPPALEWQPDDVI
ncbi:hypothetical protein CKAN_00128700 [Cinnamomum micranthum f. kanehirae]|uniref:Uncharacterized protein n=1 Tax=Cinnamomum micranthum f. kanehirae TaxID=337451 RepID=A0A443N3D3_9MAGN|nr:hypothetical protein CKAN_00128700 [Cinnamomum micranthum f. kanehirae]